MCGLWQLVVAVVVLASATSAATTVQVQASAPHPVPLVYYNKLTQTFSENATVLDLCFEQKRQITDDIDNEFRNNIFGCIEKVKEMRQSIDVKLQSNRDFLQNSVKYIERVAKYCTQLPNNEALVNCFAEQGPNMTAVSYEVTDSALNVRSTIAEHKHTIYLTKQKCCENAERIHIKKSVKNFENFRSCQNKEEMVATAGPASAEQPGAVSGEVNIDVAAPVEPSPPAPVSTWVSPTQRAIAELAPAEPAPADPALVDPAPAEPATAESAPAEPATAESAPAEPATAESAPAEPASAEPAPADPVLVGSTKTDVTLPSVVDKLKVI